MMRKIAILLLWIPLFTFAQNKDLTYSQTNDIKYTKQYRNNTVINSYITKGGLKISVGDTLTIGNAVIEREKYMFHDLFSHIVIGKAKGVDNTSFKYLPHDYSGTKVIVASIFVTHQKVTGYKLWPNRKEMPLYVSVFVKNLEGEGLSRILSYSRKTITDIEKALSSGEIVDPNKPLTKEEAIKKLKESKDLMELDLLPKEEYDKIREELTPVILDK